VGEGTVAPRCCGSRMQRSAVASGRLRQSVVARFRRQSQWGCICSRVYVREPSRQRRQRRRLRCSLSAYPSYCSRSCGVRCHARRAAWRTACGRSARIWTGSWMRSWLRRRSATRRSTPSGCRTTPPPSSTRRVWASCTTWRIRSSTWCRANRRIPKVSTRIPCIRRGRRRARASVAKLHGGFAGVRANFCSFAVTPCRNRRAPKKWPLLLVNRRLKKCGPACWDYYWRFASLALGVIIAVDFLSRCRKRWTVARRKGVRQEFADDFSRTRILRAGIHIFNGHMQNCLFR